MTNQELLDEIEYSLPRRLMTPEIREKILEATWQVLSDHREEPKEGRLMDFPESYCEVCGNTLIKNETGAVWIHKNPELVPNHLAHVAKSRFVADNHMAMPNIFPHAKDEELKAWNVVVDYSLPKGTLKVSPDVFSALHEFGARAATEQMFRDNDPLGYMQDSLLYPDTSKMPMPREPFKRADNGDPDTIVPAPAPHKKHPGFPK